MIRYELKKVFVKPGSRIALLLLALLLGVVCFFAMDVGYVNEQGKWETGIHAMRKLREVKKEWEGELTEDVLASVIAENARINGLPGYWGEEGFATDMGYGWKQGIYDICRMLSTAFGALPPGGLPFPKGCRAVLRKAYFAAKGVAFWGSQ